MGSPAHFRHIAAFGNVMARSTVRIAIAAMAAFCAAGTVPVRAADRYAYTVDIRGGSDDLNARFTEVSRLVQAKDRPPPGLAGLEQRAQNDAEAFESVLRSQGYYDGTVAMRFDDSVSPTKVTMTAEPGQRYVFGSCKIVYVSPAPAKAPKACNDIGLAEGRPARAETVIKAGKALLHKLQTLGRPAPEIVKQRAVVDHLTKTMRLTFRTDPGRQARFGKVVVSGAENTKHDFLARIVPWKDGDLYDVRELDKYRQRLANLNLFDSLTVKPDVTAETASEAVPISVSAHERLPHSVGLGLKYATDTGPGGKATWENRNLWGRAEDLKFSLELGTIGQSIEGSLTLPHEPNTGQTLGFSVKTEHDSTDAYDKNGLTGLAQITTPLGGHWTGKGGVAFEAADVKQSGASVFNILGSLPVGVTFDSTGSLLNPRHGERLALQARPVFGTAGGARAFLVLETTASAYRPLDTKKKLIAAARIRLGTILFSPELSVPPDFRFYSGGGGSVRGFAYQHVGPRDATGDPLGGRAVAETSLELRYRAWKDIGLVGFVDAGTVSTSPYFADAEAPRIGAGIGVRYYTSFGPLRLDVGVPVNPHDGDAPVQVYVSLGQAF